MLSKTDAIVLHSFRYDDHRLIVDLFTREHGRLSVIVSLPRTARGKLKKQYFQPLTLLSVECDVRPQRQLQTLREASLLTPCSSLLVVPEKLSICLFLAEFLYHALKGEQQNEPLFDYVRTSLEWLDECTERYANFHLVFLMRLSRFLGFYPNLDLRSKEQESINSLYFDLRSASFCCDVPQHRDFLMPQEAGRVLLLMRMDYPTMHLFRLSRVERRRILDILLHYYRLHLPDFPELHSLSVLQELFNDNDK